MTRKRPPLSNLWPLAVGVTAIAALTLGIAIGHKIEGANKDRHYAAVIERESDRLDAITAQLDSAMFRLQQYAERTTFTALASWYGEPFHGRRAADGSVYDQYGLTVAHPELPFGTVLLIENTDNGKRVYAVVTDRGPFVSGRSLDVSLRVAEYLGMVNDGLAVVRCRVLDVAPRPSTEN